MLLLCKRYYFPVDFWYILSINGTDSCVCIDGSLIYMCACLKRKKEKTTNSQGSLPFYIGGSLTYIYFYLSEEKKEDYSKQRFICGDTLAMYKCMR